MSKESLDRHYEGGYRARLADCYRMIWCGTEAECNEWYRGWDDADLVLGLEHPVTQTAKDH